MNVKCILEFINVIFELLLCFLDDNIDDDFSKKLYNHNYSKHFTIN